MTRTLHALGALALLIGITACSGGDDADDDPRPDAPSSSQAAPSTDPGPSEAPASDLRTACTTYASENAEGLDEALLITNAVTAESIVEAGDDEVRSVFDPVAVTAGAALDAIGTDAYPAAEQAYVDAVAAASKTCEPLGSTFVAE